MSYDQNAEISAAISGILDEHNRLHDLNKDLLELLTMAFNELSALETEGYAFSFMDRIADVIVKAEEKS